MFGIAYLVCGLHIMNPTIVDGCGLITGKVPFRSENQCLDVKSRDFDMLLSQLPPNAYIADSVCYKLDKQT